MAQRVSILGRRFGRLLVIELSPRRDRRGTARYLCRCDCGNEKEVGVDNLRSGRTLSCGCLNKENIERRKVSGGSNCRVYRIWRSMLARCYNQNNQAYENYGGRGIGVCEEWRADYEAFYAWSMSNGYAPELWIDRICNDIGYEPSNCKYSTPKEQQNNKRTNRHIFINGEMKTLAQLSDETGIGYDTLKRRIECGWTGEKLLAPPRQQYSHADKIKAFYDSKKKRSV